MNSSAFVSQGDCDCSVFAQVEVVAIVVVVGRNPPDPHTCRVLASEDPDRVVVLRGQMGNLVKLIDHWSKLISNQVKL